MSDLDKLLATWSRRTGDADLSQVEPHVWARISAESRISDFGVLGFRAALIASVMAIGVVVGGAASATGESQASAFVAHSAYAPSTLLEGDQ